MPGLRTRVQGAPLTRGCEPGLFDDAGVEFTRHGALGENGEQLVEIAGPLGADLIIVGGRKRSQTGNAVFDSTFQEIMLDAPCPVRFDRAD
ncbi:MAG: universal stress protein [Halolamina sp.]|uniref:universal stress protein n=1 Tax=Halolamina sp. TaxID=1940283 RepID=UPI002FC30CFB